MTKKLLLTIGALWILILLVVVAASLIGGQQGVNIDKKANVSTSFAASAAFGNNTLVYANGQSLVAFNYASGQSKILGAVTAGLNTIDTISVSSNNNYVLFHDGQVNPTGALASQLKARGLDPTLPYWWLYNAAAQSFQPLAQGVLLAQVDNNNVYAIGGGAGGETLTTYTASDLHTIHTMTIPGSIGFFAAQGGFLLQTPQNKVLFTKDGIVNQVLFTSTTLIGVAPDKQSALAVTTSGDSRKLVAINLQNDATSTIANDIINVPVLSNDGTALYATTQDKLYAYNLSDHKKSTWKLGGSVSSLDISSSKLISLVGSSTAVIDDDSGNYFLIGNNLASSTTSH